MSLVLRRQSVTGITQTKCHWYYADKVLLVLCRQSVTGITLTECHWNYTISVGMSHSDIDVTGIKTSLAIVIFTGTNNVTVITAVVHLSTLFW